MATTVDARTLGRAAIVFGYRSARVFIMPEEPVPSGILKLVRHIPPTLSRTTGSQITSLDQLVSVLVQYWPLSGCLVLADVSTLIAMEMVNRSSELRLLKGVTISKVDCRIG
ncbi:hypothetical protein HGA91_00175 [candidate division WWE3 bacterium]|nr:hypothetical protein [candidate division WWE3 bacterium]